MSRPRNAGKSHAKSKIAFQFIHGCMHGLNLIYFTESDAFAAQGLSKTSLLYLLSLSLSFPLYLSVSPDLIQSVTFVGKC